MTNADTALLLTGGHSHPPELSMPTLSQVVTDAGLRPVVVTDLEASLAGLADSPHALLVVNALRFTMAHPRYEPFRNEWALSLSNSARDALADWVESGRPLLALHTALVSFDDWPEWGDLIGGRWDWERSSHPPLGTVEIQCDAEHPVTAGLGPFNVTDECYTDLDVRGGNTIVATAMAGGDAQPACWLREVDGCRVAVSTLGHDLQSLDQPQHRRLLTRLIDWLLDSSSTDEETSTT